MTETLGNDRLPIGASCTLAAVGILRGVVMRGEDCEQSSMFTYIPAERRVPKDHPLRAVRVMVDTALGELSWRFDAVYAKIGRPSIPPEKLLRALLLQVLYTTRGERL